MLDVKTACGNQLYLGSAGQVLAATVSPIASEAALKTVVSIRQLMQQQQIPGMAVAVLWRGKPFITALARPMWPRSSVTPDTVFELGSISKTYAGGLVLWRWNVVI